MFYFGFFADGSEVMKDMSTPDTASCTCLFLSFSSSEKSELVEEDISLVLLLIVMIFTDSL